MLHNSTNVLDKGLSNTSVIKRVCFVGQEAKGNTRRHFEAMEEGVNLAFYTRIIIKGIAVKVVKLRGVPL